jgi:pimeloyl-ACP methyl ester carboxylesterase
MLALPNSVQASTQPQYSEIEPSGIASLPLTCLAVNVEEANQNQASESASANPNATDNPGQGSTGQGVVELWWQGEVEAARIMLQIAGTEASHTILLNGHPVARTPIAPLGSACGEGELFYLDIASHVVVQGANTIELTADGAANDSWHASAVRLEVLGRFTPTGELQTTNGEADMAAVAKVQASPVTINFVNPLDTTTQQARMQVPTTYSSTVPTPLLLVIHPRSRDMFYGEDAGFHTAADGMGWFFAAPQLHGAWPGTDDAPIPNPPGQYVYASLESQYDIIGTVQYMVARYNIDPDRIYLYGQSMGAQVGEVTVAKFPSLFAAAFFNKGPSDWTAWYGQTQAMIDAGYAQLFHRQWMERECYVMVGDVPTPQTPIQNPTCYAERSSLPYVRNLQHVPISLTHSISDVLVPFSHSQELADAINTFDPGQTVSIGVDRTVGPACDDGAIGDPTPHYHCMSNDPQLVVEYLAQFTRTQPTMLNVIDLDVSAEDAHPFYWLQPGVAGGGRAEVQAAVDRANAVVNATVTVSEPITVGFNVGVIPITPTVAHPGLGFTATTYLVQTGGQPPRLAAYTGGYLTVGPLVSGTTTVTLSALEVQFAATPITRPAGTAITATLTVVAGDRLQQSPPDGSEVLLTTTAGRFANNSSTITGTLTGGQLVLPFFLDAEDGRAEIIAQVVGTSRTATVEVIEQPGQDVPQLFLPLLSVE